MTPCTIHRRSGAGSGRQAGLVLLAFLAVAAFFLITEHRARILGALPYVPPPESHPS